jgi:predicted O-methyltransferase YrrM
MKNKMLQVESEWKYFIELVSALKPKRILEIGAAYGGTSESLSKFADLLISIDTNKPKFDLSYLKGLCDYRYVVGDSHLDSGPKKVSSILGEQQLDLLFIDGDHTFAGAKLDYMMYKGFVRDGGIIAIHDIVVSDKHKATGCNVHLLWDELKEKHKYEEIIHNGQWAGIGVLWYDE